MKRTLVPLCVAVLSMFSIAGAQTLMDYVKQVKGDTLVIKDYNDMGSVANSIANVLNADTSNVPAGRVYELETNGYYPITSNPTTAARGVVIVGDNSTRLVNNTNASAGLPILCGSTVSGGSTNTGGINYGGNVTLKNCAILPCASDGSLGWTFFWGSAADCRVVLENDLFERTRWVEVASNSVAGTRLYINDCYFVNLSGQGCRRNGGVYDNVSNNTDTIWVENTTHVMAEGSMYKFRNFQIGKLFFNHNTFVNCAGSTFESLGYESNLTVTNNIFVNSNVQATCDSLCHWDVGETDPDNLPTGVVNCAPLPSDATQMDRKILVDRNVVYWDPKFDNMVSTLNTNKVDGTTNWVSQAITMNTRTQAMFNDNTTYPYLTEGTWYRKLPTFTDPKDLLTSQVDSIKAFAMATVGDMGNSPAILSDWRVVSTGASNYLYSDWPIPVNLAYSDADLKAGGTGGFPVGDLNWFPTQKATWVAQKNAEHATLEHMLNTGTVGVKNVGTLPEVYTLSQNYPNPFNPATTISFSLPHSGNVSLRVFDLLGREVATLVNGFTTAGSHEVQFDATNFASGVYLYKLTSGDFTQVKKMTLMK
jgi:hypothetical protein